MRRAAERFWAFIQRKLRNWGEARLADDPQHAIPGQGQMKPEQLEIALLKARGLPD